MNKTSPTLESFLRDNKYSLTKQRQRVFDLLSDSEPLAMAELYKLSRHGLDRASLYRTVNLFERIGVVQRLTVGWKHKFELSDTFMEHHHHLTCLKCHKVISLQGDELENFITRLSSQKEFKTIKHQIELQGYCKDCKH